MRTSLFGMRDGVYYIHHIIVSNMHLNYGSIYSVNYRFNYGFGFYMLKYVSISRIEFLILIKFFSFNRYNVGTYLV